MGEAFLMGKPSGGTNDPILQQHSTITVTLGEAAAKNDLVYIIGGETFTKLPDPTVLPSGKGKCCQFYSDSQLAVGHDSGQYITVYDITDDIFTHHWIGANKGPGGSICSLDYTTYGALYLTSDITYGVWDFGNPVVNDWFLSMFSGHLLDISIDDKDVITFASDNSSNELSYWICNQNSSYWNKYGGVNMTSGGGYSCHTVDPYTVLGFGASPYLKIVNRLTASDVYYDSISGGFVNSCRLSDNNNGFYVATANTSSPYVNVLMQDIYDGYFYNLGSPWANTTMGAGNCCAWSKEGKYLTVGYTTSPYMAIYKRSNNGVSFTQIPNPSVLPTGKVNGCAFSNIYLALAHDTSPYVTIYKRNLVAYRASSAQDLRGAIYGGILKSGGSQGSTVEVIIV